MNRTEYPLFTREMRVDEYEHPEGMGLISRSNAEEDRADASWISSLHLEDSDHFVITQEDSEAFCFVNPGARDETPVRMHEPEEIEAFLSLIPEPFTIDITGLSHRVWAPIIKMAIQMDRPPRVIYIEPGSYRSVQAPRLGEIFNLSEKREGVAPLPGFVRLEGESTGPSPLVPMLGFEGARFEFLLNTLEIDNRGVFPIIGVPGYRPVFAHHAYHGNRDALEKFHLAHQIKFAKANCPFDLFYQLMDIESWSSSPRLRLAPIGTKPHGLGAVLFAISRGPDIEIVYDHPIRSPRRTTGTARLCLYDLPAFCSIDAFTRPSRNV